MSLLDIIKFMLCPSFTKLNFFEVVRKALLVVCPWKLSYINVILF